MTFHHGWLFIDEPNGFQSELFNHARTAAYLSNSTVLGCGTVYNVLDDGGCPAYRWVPPRTLSEDVLVDEEGNVLTDPEGNMLIGVDNISSSGWYEQTYGDPISDPAPWYNPAFPESGQALGFWVSEWTGLDSGHIQREVSQVGAYRGGGAMGALGSRSREMGFEIIMIGESERALDYLFRWLDATLSSVCATCATDSITVRRFCPEVDPLDYETAAEGAVSIRGVGLISGLQWGAPPVERAGCYLRRANFTLGATDPCMYGFCTDIAVAQTMDWDECFSAVNLNPDRTNCRPSCSELDGLCRIAFDYTVDDPSASAPIVTISSPYGESSIPVRIRTYANPHGLTPSDLCGAPLLGELYVGELPPYTELRYDVPGRRIEIRNAGTGGWINGFAYIGPNDVGVPRFFSLGCGNFTTVIEPADLCYTVSDEGPVVAETSVLALQPVSPAGSLVVGGTFTTARSATQNRITRLDTLGSRVPTFNIGGTVGISGEVNSLLLQPDGKIVVGGVFATARGVTQNYIARLNSDGSLDTAFNTGGTVGVNGAVRTLSLQSDGKIIVGGEFLNARGTTVNRLARLNTDGTLDTTFNTGGTVGVPDTLWASAIQDDGKVVIGGSFTTARGTTVNRIARLSGTDGTIDTTFNTGGTVGVNGTVYAIVLLDSGPMLIGGSFTTARGTTVNRIARLNSDGTLDATFNFGGTVGVDGDVRVMAVQADGKIVVGGAFTTARGTTVNRIVRLDGTDGALDATFNTGGTVGVDGDVRAMVVRPDGRIVIGGAFSNVRGVAQIGMAVLESDGSLAQDEGINSELALSGQIGGFPTGEIQTQPRMGCA